MDRDEDNNEAIKSKEGISLNNSKRKHSPSPEKSEIDKLSVENKRKKRNIDTVTDEEKGSESIKTNIGEVDKGKDEISTQTSKRKHSHSSDESESDKVQPENKGKKRTFDAATTQDKKSPPNKMVSGKSAKSPSKKSKLSFEEEDSKLSQSKRSHARNRQNFGSVGDEREEGQKQIRKRTKYLLQAVLEQVEFYFSDSNLSKDRYVRQLMDQDKDGYVDLSVFGNFNKLQTLHKDGVSCDILKKALKRSKILQLSENKTRVRRITPFKEISQDETDRRTIYVENLPSRATHAWIRTMFAQCGNVVYVSLPVFRTTKEKKGFAFVEFDSAEGAAKACLLNNPPPEKVEMQIGKFPKFNKTLSRLQKLIPDGEDNLPEEELKPSEEPDCAELDKKKKKKKGKRKKDEDGETTMESVSENKTDTSTTQQSAVETLEVKKTKKKKKKKRSSLKIDESKTEDNPKEGNNSKDVDKGVAASNEKKKKSQGNNTDNKEPKSSNPEDDVDRPADDSKSENDVANSDAASRKKRKRKKRKRSDSDNKEEDSITEVAPIEIKSVAPPSEAAITAVETEETAQGIPLSRKERKRLRQEDIRRKKMEREAEEKQEEETMEVVKCSSRARTNSEVSQGSKCTDSENDDPNKVVLKQDGSQVTSILKTKKKILSKKVDFDLVPERNEFVRPKEVRKRKRLKKEKLHLRIISKKEWCNLRTEYIKRQKSHMSALKESLRELRMRENESNPESKGPKHVDLEDVFGTKRLKPSHEVKMAHVEKLEFIPNVIVQWKSTHLMHRDKIRSMFSGDTNIAYIDAKEEAKSGYIRFKDEESAKKYTTQCRNSGIEITTRLLPVDQQQAYWDRANEDRMKRLGRKRQERGSEKLARKVFERNKVTFQQKPNRIVFTDENDDNYIEAPKEQKRMGINDYNPEAVGDSLNVSTEDTSHELETSR